METTSEGDRLLRQSLTSRYSDWAVEALDELSGNFLITDPSISGHPIVFASPGFLEMSGYDREDVLGQNGKIFQGPETERRSVIEIREAIREERTMQITILNYRKNGTPIWILFHLFPLFGRDDGQVVHFVAVQVPILSRSSREHWRLDRTDSVVGSCRREVCEEMEMFCHLSVDPVTDSSNGERKMGCNEAGDVEKQKAADAAALVLSTLVRLSELTGKRIGRDRCNSVGILPLPSSLTISLGRIKQSFVLRDPHLPGTPIVYASDGFLNLTGYSRHEVLGRDCRFLCGPETEKEPLQKVQESIAADRQCIVRIQNYSRKDGSTFWSTLHVSPVRNATGKVAFFVGVQMEETAKTDGQGPSVEMRQLGAIGAVKVAVRSLALGSGPSKST